jgi:hypothetical protein
MSPVPGLNPGAVKAAVRKLGNCFYIFYFRKRNDQSSPGKPRLTLYAAKDQTTIHPFSDYFPGFYWNI